MAQSSPMAAQDVTPMQIATVRQTLLESYYAEGKPIRGGVPLIFPWFGPNIADPKLPAHGFARTRAWELGGVDVRDDGTVLVKLTLGPDGRSREIWPREFKLEYTVTVGRSLDMSLFVGNEGERAFRFEAAMHTYLAVSNVRNVSIDGLASGFSLVR